MSNIRLVFTFSLIFSLIHVKSFCQIDSSISMGSFESIPMKDGKIIYEKIFNIDTSIKSDKIFSSIKSVLINNTNYTNSIITDDKQEGKIVSKIKYSFYAKPGPSRLLYSAISLLVFDIRDGKYRVRIYNHESDILIMGTKFNQSMELMFYQILEKSAKNRKSPQEIVILEWDLVLRRLLFRIERLINKEITDGF